MMGAQQGPFDAWNPGLQSQIPADLLPASTLYLPENSRTTYQSARELAEMCGRKPAEMVAFRAARLAVHEVLIRVTADLCVADGPNYEDLGLSLRGMAARILNDHVRPKLPEIEAAFHRLRRDAEARLSEMLEAAFRPPEPVAAPRRHGLLALLRGHNAPAPAPADDTLPEFRAIEAWRRQLPDAPDPLTRHCLEALLAVVGGFVGQRGRLVAERDLVIRLAADRVCNSHGSQMIGDMIDPIIRAAAAAEGYRYLPFQDAPVVLNVKGASAAGKSTIRPLQRQLAERLGVSWEDFAIVSPDYWRKFLLDYDSLGGDFKYAAMLTGQELEIIDKKLDKYMAAKAVRAEMPHLLIDRFRFDSFTSLANQPPEGRLLSRFGDTVFMFFVITPPAETVERAWKRGLETGRYKAVDDLLFHNVEAYLGMPQLFFTWVKKKRQKVHFEFLDNSVPLGHRPRTVAFGWNDRITVFDMACMRSVTRYQKVNLEAKRPEDVLKAAPEGEDDILRDFIEKIEDVTFADPVTLEVLGHTRNGICDHEVRDFFARSGLAGALRGRVTADAGGVPPALDAARERKFTVGDWSLAS